MADLLLSKVSMDPSVVDIVMRGINPDNPLCAEINMDINKSTGLC